MIADRYRIDRALGQGGMGTVYVAFDMMLRRVVALKMLIAKDGPLSSGDLARFRREACLPAAVSHPNVTRVYDAGDHAGSPFVVMELIEGVNLRERLRGGGDVSLAERVRWIVELGAALAAVHRHGILHRDVKPSNVIVSAAGSVHLIDFGIAKTDPMHTAAGETAQSVQITRTGVAVGTPAYMAPEQYQGAPASYASDQYAWGRVAFECLTGIADMPATGLWPEVTQVNPAVPPHISYAVGRALASMPGMRWPSMDHLVSALDGAPPAANGSFPANANAASGDAPTRTASRFASTPPTGAGFGTAPVHQPVNQPSTPWSPGSWTPPSPGSWTPPSPVAWTPPSPSALTPAFHAPNTPPSSRSSGVFALVTFVAIVCLVVAFAGGAFIYGRHAKSLAEQEVTASASASAAEPPLAAAGSAVVTDLGSQVGPQSSALPGIAPKQPTASPPAATVPSPIAPLPSATIAPPPSATTAPSTAPVAPVTPTPTTRYMKSVGAPRANGYRKDKSDDLAHAKPAEAALRACVQKHPIPCEPNTGRVVVELVVTTATGRPASTKIYATSCHRSGDSQAVETERVRAGAAIATCATPAFRGLTFSVLTGTNLDVTADVELSYPLVQ